ncbi:MAG TPA: ABC transporter permease [Chloroflexota bacterium]|nr:ABC transporter permease [Chloroflexota bacterium]
MGNRKGLVASLLLPAYGVLLLFVFVPLCALLYFSVLDNMPGQGVTPQATWANYAAFLQQPLYVRLLLKSIALSLIVTALCVLIGWPTAYALARIVRRRRNLLLSLTVLPFLTSYLLLIYSMLVLLQPGGLLLGPLSALHLISAQATPLFTPQAVVIMLVYEYVPFMILGLYSSLERIDDGLVEAARSLGASPPRIFRTVLLPLSLPGLEAGLILVFIPATGSFIEPQILGGPNGLLLGSVINDQINAVDNWPFAASLSFLLIAAVLLVALAATGVLRLGVRRWARL